MWMGCLFTAVGAMRPAARMRSIFSWAMLWGEKERQEYLWVITSLNVIAFRSDIRKTSESIADYGTGRWPAKLILPMSAVRRLADATRSFFPGRW